MTLVVLSPPAERVADGGFEGGDAAWTFAGSAQRSTGGFPLGFAGKTVVLRLRATTDVSLPTTFRVDDVSVR